MFRSAAIHLRRNFHWANLTLTPELSVILPLAFLFFLPSGAYPQTRSSAPNFATLAKQAAEARDSDHLDEAARLYTQALALRPKWTEGWWSLGTLEYDHDHYAKAALAFQKLLALDPANGTAHAMLGLCQFELKKDEPALKNLLAAERLGIVKNEQLRKVAVYHLGVLQLRARKYRDAKDTLDHLAQDGIHTKELIAALGLAALLVPPQEAPPEGTDGAAVIDRAGEAEAALASNDFDQARQKYAELVSEFPNYPNLHFAFGRLLLERHETDEAIEQFQLELKRDPANVNSLLEIAAVRYLVDSQDGLPYAQQAVKLAPQMPFAHYLLGLLLLDTGNFQSAIPELETARKGLSQTAAVYFALGNAYARAGRKAEAAQARATFKRLDRNSHPESTGDEPPVTNPAVGKVPAGDAKPPR
jgi:tetratricopeptide (TPR) repeat protein